MVAFNFWIKHDFIVLLSNIQHQYMLSLKLCSSETSYFSKKCKEPVSLLSTDTSYCDNRATKYIEKMLPSFTTEKNSLLVNELKREITKAYL